MKFSIIIPVYNVEKYLKKCIESVLNQTYQNFEIIVINDGSTDNSELVLNEYIGNNKIKIIKQTNHGLSYTRNIGVKHAKGDYILFLDSDDYYEKDLLKTLNDNIKDNIEIIRFQIEEIRDNKITEYKEQPFETTTGIKAFAQIRKYHYIELACCYCYNLNFWKKNNFKYKENCISEDFGLTPLVIFKAIKIKSIDYIGYNYVQRENSIINNNDYNKKIKRMNDLLLQADILKKEIKNKEGNYYFLSFINDSLIYNITTLNKKDYKKYKKILKQRKCFDYIENNTLKRKIKKAIIKVSPYLFYNYINKLLKKGDQK